MNTRSDNALPIAEIGAGALDGLLPERLPIPRYLEQLYWWAYVHPLAVHWFERQWLVDAILFGNYGRLCDAALRELSGHPDGRTLQIACVYGNLTERLRLGMASGGRLDVVDILPVQLSGLSRKIIPDPRVALKLGNSASLAFPDASYDQALLFFLLHEQPPEVRVSTVAEALRVVRPGGKIVVVDYHRPHWWHPLGPLMRIIFRLLEPFAGALWRNSIESFFPRHVTPAGICKSTYFGGLYQMVVITR